MNIKIKILNQHTRQSGKWEFYMQCFVTISHVTGSQRTENDDLRNAPKYHFTK